MLQRIKRYFSNRKTAKIEKMAKIVKNIKAIREDRWAAIEFLQDIDDVNRAVPALLQRFEYSLEHGINDTREKELALAGIVKYGEKALPYLKEHLSKTTRIAWPIKALKSLGREELLVEALTSALNFEDVAFDQSAVDKNYDVLCYLRDYKLQSISGKLRHFLSDPDERVRFAAVELMIDQNDPEAAPLLEHFLIDVSSENRRLRQAVQHAFTQRQWAVSDSEIAKSYKAIAST